MFIKKFSGTSTVRAARSGCAAPVARPIGFAVFLLMFIAVVAAQGRPAALPEPGAGVAGHSSAAARHSGLLTVRVATLARSLLQLDHDASGS